MQNCSCSFSSLIPLPLPNAAADENIPHWPPVTELSGVLLCAGACGKEPLRMTELEGGHRAGPALILGEGLRRACHLTEGATGLSNSSCPLLT